MLKGIKILFAIVFEVMGRILHAFGTAAMDLAIFLLKSAGAKDEVIE